MALEPPHQEQNKTVSMVTSHLLTPEEPLAHSFTKSVPLPPIQTASPPASPEFRSFATFEQKDEVLYPDNTTQRHASEQPLFGNSNRWDASEREQSPASQSSISGPATPQNASPLQNQPELAKLAITDDSAKTSSRPVGVVGLYKYHGLDYWRYVTAQNEEHRRRRMERKLPQPGDGRRARRDQYTEKLVSSLGRSRVEKPRTVTPATPKTKVTKPAPTRPTTRADAFPSMPKSESPVKRSRRKASTPDAAFGAYSQVPQPKPRTRAAPSKKVDDKEPEDWTQIPDLCPPISSLDTGSKKLTVVWSNANALDLSNDPDRNYLHPQELEVAQALRLKCNQYLANKRRIFVARVNALREGKEFNKTSAQTNTKIDVNKASRLWSAFDGVGWFDEHWFQQHL